MRPKPTAIGYLRTDVSGCSQSWDEAQIRSRAKRLGYELAKTVTFGATTDRPLHRLLEVVRHADADAVIVPGAAHFGGQIPDALVRVCEVNTVSPENTYARRPFSISSVPVDGA